MSTSTLFHLLQMTAFLYLFQPITGNVNSNVFLLLEYQAVFIRWNIFDATNSSDYMHDAISPRSKRTLDHRITIHKQKMQRISAQPTDEEWKEECISLARRTRNNGSSIMDDDRRVLTGVTYERRSRNICKFHYVQLEPSYRHIHFQAGCKEGDNNNLFIFVYLFVYLQSLTRTSHAIMGTQLFPATKLNLFLGILKASPMVKWRTWRRFLCTPTAARSGATALASISSPRDPYGVFISTIGRNRATISRAVF
jgi:hypothetical protein